MNISKYKKYQKRYRLKNKASFKKYSKKYYKKHKMQILKQKKKYAKKRRDKIKQYQHKRYIKKKKQIIKRIVAYNKNRLQVDLLFRLQHNLRGRIAQAIKGNYRSGSAVKDLGCTIEEFKQYIQDKFYGDMIWKNYGSYWELDHIVPLHTFDLTNRKQLLEACHYSNMQPLTIKDHREKSNRDIRL